MRYQEDKLYEQEKHKYNIYSLAKLINVHPRVKEKNLQLEGVKKFKKLLLKNQNPKLHS